MSDLKQFLELFNPLPGNNYLQVTTDVDEITDALYDLLKTVNGEFRLALYSEKKIDISQKFPSSKIQYIENFTQPFRAMPRDNDIVIFKDFFHLHQNPKLILKIAYTTLANSANIIIMQKKGTMDIVAIEKLLEEFEFRASNYIDVLPQYDLVIAKKMHMWGNGL